MSEDLKPSGDITTKLIKNNKKIKAKIVSNQNCIVGGLSFAKEAFKYSDRKVNFKTKTKDGKKIKKGKVVAIIHGKAKGNFELNYGSYGLKARTPGRISARQIEAARRAITREMQREGRVWIRIFPDVPVTKKPIEVRMGKGKGNVEFWVSRVHPGRILFEIDGVSENIAKNALMLGAAKLPIKSLFIKRMGI